MNMVAGGGIEPQMPVFQGKTTPLLALFQYNPSLFPLTRFNPLTEDFTEGFLAVDTFSQQE
jgi:hypothetical protein